MKNSNPLTGILKRLIKLVLLSAIFWPIFIIKNYNPNLITLPLVMLSFFIFSYGVTVTVNFDKIGNFVIKFYQTMEKFSKWLQSDK